MNEKIKEILTNCFGYIIVAITCGLYILTTVFVLNPSGKDLGQIIGEGILAFCMGISINYLLSVQGILNGMNTKSVENTMKLYSQSVVNVSNNINKLGEWCHNKNLITYKRQRTKILARAGLKYEDCFYEDGTAKDFILKCEEKPIVKDKEALKDEKKRKAEISRIKHLKNENKRILEDFKYKRKCYTMALKLNLTELFPSDLTSEGGKKDDPNYLGKTVGEYISVSSLRDIIAKLSLAVVFGIYGIELIQNFSWVNLIWTGFQICVFLCFGFIKMQMSYMFVTTDYRGRIIKKIDNLEEFSADMKMQEGVIENGEIHKEGI